MNRDESEEVTEEVTEAATEEAVKMVANQADVAMRKRLQITKAAKRFERYGQVGDGQDLVQLVGDIAGAVEGKPRMVEPIRHRHKEAS